MNSIWLAGFTLMINFIETCFIFYLLSNKLLLKKSPFLLVACFIFECTAVTLMNYLAINSTFRMIITLIIDILITFIISLSKPAETLFWGSIYIIIVIFADTITFELGALLTSHSATALLYEPPISLIMTLIYLFICFCSVFILTRKKGQLFTFPWYIYLIFIMLIVFGILGVELLLDLLLELNHISKFAENILFFSISVILLILVFSILLIRYLGILYRKNLELMKENQQIQFERQQYELLINTTKMLQIWKHDFSHHISVLQIMAKNGEMKQLENYLNTINQKLEQKTWKTKTGNSVIDAIFTSKLPRIENDNIAFTHSIFLPEKLPLENLELASLLGNLLDNAIEACEQIPETEKRFIKIEIKPYNQFLFFDITNSTLGTYHFDTFHHLTSTKKEIGHGIGLKRVEHIVSNANGFLEITPEDNLFHINILIPLHINIEETHSNSL